MKTELQFEEGLKLTTTLPRRGPLDVNFSIRHTLTLPEDAQRVARYLRFCAAHLDSMAEIMKRKEGNND